MKRNQPLLKHRALATFVSKVKGTATKAAGVIIGLPESVIMNVTLENVELSAPEGLTIRNAKGVELKNVRTNVEHGENIIPQNAQIKEPQ